MKHNKLNFKTYPIDALNPVGKKKLLNNLSKYNKEERLLSLILGTMMAQLDDIDKRLPYVQKILRSLRIINEATAYVPEFIEISNKIWEEAFEEKTVNISIHSFCSQLMFKRRTQFERIGINYKHVQKLQRNGAIEGYDRITFSIVMLMLDKIDWHLEFDKKGINDL